MARDPVRVMPPVRMHARGYRFPIRTWALGREPALYTLNRGRAGRVEHILISWLTG